MQRIRILNKSVIPVAACCAKCISMYACACVIVVVSVTASWRRDRSCHMSNRVTVTVTVVYEEPVLCRVLADELNGSSFG
jgi:hypothetical protein